MSYWGMWGSFASSLPITDAVDGRGGSPATATRAAASRPRDAHLWWRRRV